MKTPNFTTRIPTEMLTEFRQAADLWAKRNKNKQYLAGGESRNLTRWMLTKLQEAAKEEIEGLDRGLNSSL